MLVRCDGRTVQVTQTSSACSPYNKPLIQIVLGFVYTSGHLGDKVDVLAENNQKSYTIDDP
jgi:hypothetical protein